MPENIDIVDSFGNPVSGILSVPTRASSVVVMSHGFGSSKGSTIYRELGEGFTQMGIGALRYDYYGHGPAYGHHGPGYGLSDDVTLSKAVVSLTAMIGHIRERGDYNIGLLGASFGGLVSLVVASHDQDIRTLALKSPVTEPISFWRGRIRRLFGEAGLEQWRAAGIIHYSDGNEDYDLRWGFWEDLQKYDILGDAREVACPTLIVHGERDDCVPISQSQELAKVLGTEVRVVKGADHGYSSPGQYDEVKGLLTYFMSEVL